MKSISNANNQITFLGDVWTPKDSDISLPSSLSTNVIANLEAPICTGRRNAPGKICIESDESRFLQAFPMPPIAVCLANNHTFDFGDDGFEETIRALERHDIAYFGAGSEVDNFNNPLRLRIEDQNVALMGYVCQSTNPASGTGSYGAAPLELERIQRDIDSAKRADNCRVVISIHWGIEQFWLPKPEDIKLAKSILHAGADLIIGHHPHCVQPVWNHQNKKVFFSLGNACFPDFNYLRPDGTVTRVVQRKWNRESLVVSYNPINNVADSQMMKASNDGYEMLPVEAAQVNEWHGPPCNGNWVKYTRRLKYLSKLAAFRLMAYNFCDNPRVPSFKSLTYAIKKLTGRAD